MAEKYPPRTRRFKLFDRLKGLRFPLPISDLAAQFGVHDDTIRRDLACLETAGYPIDFTYDREHEGRTLVRMRGASIVEGPFTQQEAHALRTLRQFIEPFRGTPLCDAFDGLEAKVLDTFSPKERAEMERARGWLVVIPTGALVDYGKKRDVIENLRLSIVSRRAVQVVYSPDDAEPVECKLEPAALCIYRRAIWVLGNVERDGTRTPVRWLVHDLVSVELTRDSSEAWEGPPINACFGG